jgi:hypothetical protein
VDCILEVRRRLRTTSDLLENITSAHCPYYLLKD